MPPDPSPDAALVARARQGDRAAWGELYERYADRLLDYAYRLTGSRAEAGDCVQDAFVLAAQRVGQLRDPEKLRPWLYAIVRSTAHRHYRRANRWSMHDVPETAAPGTGDDAVIGELTAADLAALVAEAAAGLTDDDREVLDLSLRHDLAPAEIAAALGVSTSHAAVTTERMRERLGRSITVTVLARRPECADLAALVAKEGPLSPLSRKRLSRHVDSCAACSAQAQRQVRPEALLAIAPLPLLFLPRRAFADFASEIDAALEAARHSGAPADGGLDWRDDGFPVPVRPRRKRHLLVAAATLGSLLLGGALVGWAVRGDGTAGSLAVGDGATGSSGTATSSAPTDGAAAGGGPSATAVTDPVDAASTTGPPLDGDPSAAGRQPDPTAPVPGGPGAERDDQPPPGPTATQAPAATAPPGAATSSTRPPTATSSPSAPTTPAAATTTSVVAAEPPVPTSTPGPTTTAAPATTAGPTTTVDAAGPALGTISGSPGDLTVVSSGSPKCKAPPTFTSSYPTSATVSVTATDPSGIASVTFTWTSGSASGGGAMSPSGGSYTATIGGLGESAAPLGGSTTEVTVPVSITVTATDTGGHTSTTTRSGAVNVHNCYLIV